MAKIEKDKTQTIRIWANNLPELLRAVADFLETPKAPRALWSVEISPNQAGGCAVGGRPFALDVLEIEEEFTGWIAFLTHYRS